MSLIDPVLLKERLAPMAGRFDVDALESCDSTSTELLRRAALGAPPGTVIVADRQLAGRGRRGRSWSSSEEDGLTFSLLWRLPAGRIPGGLSLAVGVALAQALTSLGATRVRLKWPNDVLLASDSGFAKLAGILVELASDRRGTQACIGIGLNLAAPAGDFPQPVAGLTQAMATVPDRHEVLATILLALVEVLDRFAGAGFAGLKADWLGWHAWQDRPVQLLGDGESPVTGICRGVDDDGALLLEMASGMSRILAGDLSLRAA
jgi:BirA family biotin operon repressor/biotin-[acetyl-CoA-carboxylase] ligase